MSARVGWRALPLAVAIGLLTSCSETSAQAGPALSTCDGAPPAPACAGVRGDRAGGWLPQSRSEVMARRGMVATSQPLATQAGLRILQQGGNAVDAAVAAAAVLSVVEPMSVGPAGDLFAVLYVARDRKVYVLDASGTAPTGATIERFEKAGYRYDPRTYGPGNGMPGAGILSVTVPGSVWGWDEVVRRFGRLGLKQDLAPAVEYAEGGFPVAERVARDWRLPNALPTIGCCTAPDPEAERVFLVDGKAPAAGQTFRNPGFARLLRLLQEKGRDAFYKGEVAQAIVARSRALGGTMELSDLAGYAGKWVEPAPGRYRGLDLLELPPPSQAWAAVEMLNVLEACVPRWSKGRTLASLGPNDPRYWHYLVEAKKLAYADLYAWNADPAFVPVPIARLLSRAYAESLCSRVNPEKASAPGPRGPGEGAGDTIVLSVADGEGNVVAWVNSLYAAFGSGIAVAEYGMVLHNRGALFSLDPASPNAIAPGKRPFNTLSAGIVLREGKPLTTVALMGGDMQPQGHGQLLVSLLDLGANAQAAVDLARFRHDQRANVLGLESPLHARVGAGLAAMGHVVRSIDGTDVGGAQIILIDPATGAYRAGSDPRKDGQAAGW